MEKVIAVVVTYNRQSLLSECINALRSQTRRLDAILVVNNGSTDSTEEWLKKQSDVFFCFPEKCWLKWRIQHGHQLGIPKWLFLDLVHGR